MNLLLVDEDQHFARILGTVLENDGHQVFVTADAAGAVALYSAQSPAMVLISADLPRNAGISLLRELRRRPGGTELTTVVMAAHDSSELRRECEELEVGHLLVRPVSMLDLATLIRTIDEARPSAHGSVDSRRIDLHNLQQLTRWWALSSTGVLQVRGERAEGAWITMARGGPLGPESMGRLRAALYGGELDFQACEVDGVGDRAGLAVLLWEAATGSEAGREPSPSRTMSVARTRVTDAVGDLPAPLAVRRMLELLDAPTSLGMLCDQVGADANEIGAVVQALVAMGMISLQGRSLGSPAENVVQTTTRPRPALARQDEITVSPRGRAERNAPSSAPPERPWATPAVERPRSTYPGDRPRSIFPSDRPFSSAPRSMAPPDRPFAKDELHARSSGRAGDAVSRGEAPRSTGSVSADRPFAPRSNPPSGRDPEAVEPPSEYSRAPDSRAPERPGAADAAALRRARRDVDVLRGSDAWVVLGVPRDAPRDLVERAAARMVARYETLSADSEGELRDLALQLLGLVQKAAAELAATHAVTARKDQPGDDAFRSGLKAMAEGDWPAADRRFAHARDQNLDSPRNLAHLGWARFHNPDLGMAERVQDGLDLLRLAEQLDPNYPDGQYFLAVVLHRKGEDEAALRRIRRALKTDGSHVAANALARKLRRPAPP